VQDLNSIDSTLAFNPSPGG